MKATANSTKATRPGWIIRANRRYEAGAALDEVGNQNVSASDYGWPPVEHS